MSYEDDLNAELKYLQGRLRDVQESLETIRTNDTSEKDYQKYLINLVKKIVKEIHKNPELYSGPKDDPIPIKDEQYDGTTSDPLTSEGAYITGAYNYKNSEQECPIGSLETEKVVLTFVIDTCYLNEIL